MLDTISFYEYFYKLGDDLFHKKKELERRLKYNLGDYVAYDMLRDINTTLNAYRRVYNDLKGFYDNREDMIFK